MQLESATWQAFVPQFVRIFNSRSRLRHGTTCSIALIISVLTVHTFSQVHGIQEDDLGCDSDPTFTADGDP
jgi:hypothetical protein